MLNVITSFFAELRRPMTQEEREQYYTMMMYVPHY